MQFSKSTICKGIQFLQCMIDGVIERAVSLKSQMSFIDIVAL